MGVFVTGGSGFLGQHLVRAYAAAGTPVRALARSARAAETVAAAGAEPVGGDLGDVAALRDAMAGCDLVVHAAGNTDGWAPPEAYRQVNVVGTGNVLDAARAAGVPRLVHVSTEAVLADGHPLHHVDERYPRPATVIGCYAETKGEAEDMVLAANDFGLATVVVRPRLIWGPGDTTILPALVRAARAGRFAWVDGGRYPTSTCHVANACAGILAAGERGRPGQVYFLTDGEPVRFRTFLTALAGAAGVDLGDRSMPRALAWTVATLAEAGWRLLSLAGEPPVTRTFLALSGQEMTVNDGKARAELGYRPVLTRTDGLAELAALAGVAGTAAAPR